MEFEDNEFYKHPSSSPNGDGFKGRFQVVRKRNKKKLAWVGQWNFLDVADFGTDLLHCNQITEDMEKYAFTVLAFCHNYHSVDDLKLNGSSVVKLRQLYKDGKLSNHEEFLQNIQDSAYNFGRIRPTQDNLQANTEPFIPTKNVNEEEEETDEQEDDEVAFLQGRELDSFLEGFEMDLENGDSEEHQETYNVDYTPITFNLNKIRKKVLFHVVLINYVKQLLTKANKKTLVAFSQLHHLITYNLIHLQ